MSKEVKRYAERDAYELDEAGNYYCRHVMAMTSEGLHGKSDIAAELAWRDQQIDALLAERDAMRLETASLRGSCAALGNENKQLRRENKRQSRTIAALQGEQPCT